MSKAPKTDAFGYLQSFVNRVEHRAAEYFSADDIEEVRRALDELYRAASEQPTDLKPTHGGPKLRGTSESQPPAREGSREAKADRGDEAGLR